MKKWYRQKTTWTGITMIVGGIQGLVLQTVSPEVSLMGIFNGLLFIFLRQGVEKVKNGL